MSGRLVIVSSPIGNLDDLSARARNALEEADIIACEDTRHSGRLLSHLGIKKKLISLHEHNERERSSHLVSLIEEGRVVALLSDAGTPLISDPGYPLVREAAEKGLRVEPIPGPSAVITALVASALPPYPFTFVGFSPPQSKKRRRFYRQLQSYEHTLILFESPHRIVASLVDALNELGDRPAAVCRELTKMHEEVIRGSLTEVHEVLAARPSVKGEIVLVIGRPPKEK